MAITIVQKTKGKVVAKEKTDLEIKVDRLIELKVVIDEAKARVAEYEKIRKELVTIAEGASANNEQVIFTGELGQVALSPKSFERKISDMSAVFTLLGKDTFLKLASIKLADLDKYVSATEQDQVVVQELTGPRKISVFPKENQMTEA